MHVLKKILLPATGTAGTTRSGEMHVNYQSLLNFEWNACKK